MRLPLRSVLRRQQRLAEQVAIIALTLGGFWLLRQLDLLAPTPLWVFGALMVAQFVLSESLYRRSPHGLLHLQVALLMAAITVVMYATGWGPVLTVGYMYGVAEAVRRYGARAAWPALGWSLAGIAAGQVAVATGLAPSLLRPHFAHGLAVLGGLGLLFPTGIIAATAAQKEASEAELARQAFFDPVSKLPNRTLFVDRLTHALDRAERRGDMLAVLFLDLDRFKVVNDSLGHEIGDRLLAAVGQRMRACLRPADTLARLGGDEFTVLIEDVADVRDAVVVAERITEALGEPLHLGSHEVVTTASIGIAVGVGGRDHDPEQLLRHADLAMYQAKEHGRARYEVFDASMGTRARLRLELEGRLRHAVEEGEFVVHYQPEVDVVTERVVGMEALVRWARPGPTVPPRDLVPLAEETGLILPLGHWVLEEACTRAREWFGRPGDDGSVVIAVNLSARQFQQPDLVGEIGDVLGGTGLDPHRLRMEITESAVMQDVETSMAVVRRLKSLGVQIAIDDFGTGYSSLSYLSRFPADVLKVDRSFVARLDEEPEIPAIVEAIVAMAHSLGMRVTAEGVETSQQLAALRRLGADTCQGYWFSPPVPGDVAERILASPTAWCR